MANYSVLLVCAGGMSSGMLEGRTREAARVARHSLTIRAVSASEISTCDFNLTPVDLVLLAPQVRFKKMSIIERAAPFGIIVQEIAPLTFGMMDGEKIFEQILRAIPKEKRND